MMNALRQGQAVPRWRGRLAALPPVPQAGGTATGWHGSWCSSAGWVAPCVPAGAGARGLCSASTGGKEPGAALGHGLSSSSEGWGPRQALAVLQDGHINL